MRSTVVVVYLPQGLCVVHSNIFSVLYRGFPVSQSQCLNFRDIESYMYNSNHDTVSITILFLKLI